MTNEQMMTGAQLGMSVLTTLVIPTVLMVAGPYIAKAYRKWDASATDAQAKQRREVIHAATKGVYLLLSKLAPETPTTIDDELVKILAMVEENAGVELTEDEKTHVARVALSMHADPTKPDLNVEADVSSVQEAMKKLYPAATAATAVTTPSTMPSTTPPAAPST